ncbi:MAG: T9SS type A sorting domain-containing protein [Bacteroidota bacterium]
MVSPNHSANDFITIANKGGQMLENTPYDIVGSNGALVERGTLVNSQVDIRSLPKGIYFIHLEEWGVESRFVKN